MITMRFEGGQELAAAINALSARASKRAMVDALQMAAEPLRSRAERLAPRAPGAPDIADHIMISPARLASVNGARTAAVAIGPEKGFFYGFFLEYGTKHMSARAFMRPAFDSEAEKMIQAFGAFMWTALAAEGVSRSIASALPVMGEA